MPCPQEPRPFPSPSTLPFAPPHHPSSYEICEPEHVGQSVLLVMPALLLNHHVPEYESIIVLLDAEKTSQITGSPFATASANRSCRVLPSVPKVHLILKSSETPSEVTTCVHTLCGRVSQSTQKYAPAPPEGQDDSGPYGRVSAHEEPVVIANATPAE